MGVQTNDIICIAEQFAFLLNNISWKPIRIFIYKSPTNAG